MKQDLAQKIGTNSLIIPTDKTNNFYNMEISNYIITKDYKKADQNTPQEINLEAKHIAKSLQIKDRITTTNTTDAYITLKDHKLNFTNNPKCRLINPSKTEMGIISKRILDRINKAITPKLALNIWTNTSEIINWFTNLDNKRLSFVVFDFVDFYPSISNKLLHTAIEFAAEHTTITDRIKKSICKIF